MRLFLITYLLLLFVSEAKAQNGNNYLEVIANTSLNFNCNSPETLENDQTINGAFTIRVRSRNSNCSIYAKLSSYTGPSGYMAFPYPIQLVYTSTNSSRAYGIVNAPLSLTTSDQLIFSQYSSNSVFNYYYNLRLKALGYTYPIGQYSFTILYTMTQP